MDTFGWILGLTYGTQSPFGVDYNYCSRLLDEMTLHGMNILSIMMQSYAFFDPLHDGYCWPVKNPKLECYRDINAINANEKTEFLSKIIEKAEKCGIEIELALNWGIWNTEKIKTSYPGVLVQQHHNKKRSNPKWVHCPDAPDCWQLGLDEVEDLLRYYNHPNVKRFTFERVGYVGNGYCACPHTKALISSDNQMDLTHGPNSKLIKWKVDHISQLITEYVKHIKHIKPNIMVGIHSLGNLEWGHDPKQFSKCGLSYVQPHTIQFKMRRHQLYDYFNYLSPNPLIPHFDVRDTAPTNYPIWKKSPKIIHTVAEWIHQYPKENIKGIIFFNEASVSAANRKATYDAIKQLRMLE